MSEVPIIKETQGGTSTVTSDVVTPTATTDAVNGRNLFKYGTETLVSNKFLHGASLDVITLLEPFCDEAFPTGVKSIAYLVPYGSRVSTTKLQQQVVGGTASSGAIARTASYSTLASTQLNLPRAGVSSPWDYRDNKIIKVKTNPQTDLASERKDFEAYQLSPFVVNDDVRNTIDLFADPSEIPTTNTTFSTLPDFPIGVRRRDVSSFTDVNNPEVTYSTLPVINGASALQQVEGIDFSSSDCGDYRDIGGFVFLMNPENMSFNVSGKWQEAETWADITQGRAVQWQGNENTVLSINSLQVPGYTYRRVVQPIVDAAFDLLLKPSDNGVDPIVWSFVWGERVFEPCIITSVRVTERGWYKGKSVIAEINLEIKQVPEWQVNDGLDIIIYSDIIQSQALGNLNTQNNSIQGGSSAATQQIDLNSSLPPNEAEAIKIFAQAQQSKNKCTKAEDFRQAEANANIAKEKPSDSNAKATNVLLQCKQTARKIIDKAEVEKAFTNITNETWRQCCGLLEILIKQEKEAKTNQPVGGQSGGNTILGCESINVDTLDDAAEDFYRGLIQRAASLFEVLPEYLRYSRENNTDITKDSISIIFKLLIEQKLTTLTNSELLEYVERIQDNAGFNDFNPENISATLRSLYLYLLDSSGYRDFIRIASKIEEQLGAGSTFKTDIQLTFLGNNIAIPVLQSETELRNVPISRLATNTGSRLTSAFVLLGQALDRAKVLVKATSSSESQFVQFVRGKCQR